MKKTLLVLLLLIFPVLANANEIATRVDTVTTNFNGSLSTADTTVQKALDTLDNLTMGISIGDSIGNATPNSVPYIDSSGNLAENNPAFTYNGKTFEVEMSSATEDALPAYTEAIYTGGDGLHSQIGGYSIAGPGDVPSLSYGWWGDDQATNTAGDPLITSVGLYGTSIIGSGVYGYGNVGVYGAARFSGGIGLFGRGNGTGSIAISAYTSATDGYAIRSEGGKNYFVDRVGIGIDTPLAPLHVNSNAAGLASLVSGSVSNTTNGPTFRIQRVAAEGTTYMDCYVDQFQGVNWDTSNASVLQIGRTTNAVQLVTGNANATVRIGDSFGTSGFNPKFELFGYLSSAVNKYVRFQVSGSTNNFELTRQDSNIPAFDIQMPLWLTLTTEQQRIRYNSSNYYKTTVGSGGLVTIEAVGSSPGFYFPSNGITIGSSSSNQIFLSTGGLFTLGQPSVGSSGNGVSFDNGGGAVFQGDNGYMAGLDSAGNITWEIDNINGNASFGAGTFIDTVTVNNNKIINGFLQDTLPETPSSNNGTTLTGTMYFASAGDITNGIVTGIGTDFVNQLKVGDRVNNTTGGGSGEFGNQAGYFYVKKITSATSFTLNKNAGSQSTGTGAAFSAKRYRSMISVADASGNLNFTITDGGFYGAGSNNYGIGNMAPNSFIWNGNATFITGSNAGNVAFYQWASTGGWYPAHSDNGSPSLYVAYDVPNGNVKGVFSAGNDNLYVTAAGNVGIGTTSPTARLHLPAGTATADTAPLKFTAGTNLTSAVAGAMEYDGTELYFSPSTTRYKLGQVTAGGSNIASGVYTPTRSAEANLDANVTMTEAQYMRVGNTVTVSGRFTADPTLAATTTSFEITLPVASNIGAAEDAAGTAFCGSIAAQGAEVIGVAANDTAKIQWKSGDVTSQTWSYTLTYQII